MKIRKAAFAVAGLLFATLSTATAQSQGTPEQRAACMGDALMLCASVVPNTTRITACLGSKLSQLSPACRAQFVKHRNAAR